MNICYVLGNSLYINLTNRCTNQCTFCVRDKDCGIGDINLWLEREPTVEEVIKDIEKFNPKNYQEVVFCGYGEPTLRLDVILEVAHFIKENYNSRIRINTNGHANLVYKRDVTKDLAEVVDVVSISLNAKNAKEYQEICKCAYGEIGFDAMLDFAKCAKSSGIDVVLSIVDVLSEDDKSACSKISEDIGVKLRIRSLIE